MAETVRFTHPRTGSICETDPETAAKVLKERSAEVEEAPEVQTEAEKPSGNASKDEWLAYRVAEGYDPEEIGEMTRDELRDLD